MEREKNRLEWKNTIIKWNVSIDDEIGRESWQNFSPLFRWYAEQLKGEIRMKLPTSLLHPQHWWLATISRLNREIQQFDLDQSGRKCVWPTTIINNDPKRETGFPLIHHIDPVPHRCRSSTLSLTLSFPLSLEPLYSPRLSSLSPSRRPSYRKRPSQARHYARWLCVANERPTNQTGKRQPGDKRNMLLRDRRARPWTERHWPRSERYVFFFYYITLSMTRFVFLPSFFLFDTPISCLSISLAPICKMTHFKIFSDDFVVDRLSKISWLVYRIRFILVRNIYNIIYRFTYVYISRTYVRYEENINKLKFSLCERRPIAVCSFYKTFFCES